MEICDYCLTVFKLQRSALGSLTGILPTLTTIDRAEEQPTEKKAKLSLHCSLCLGLTSQSTIEAIVEEVLHQLETKSYGDISLFVLAIHAPLSLKVRRMGMEHLLRTLPNSDIEGQVFSDEYYVKVEVRSQVRRRLEEREPGLTYSLDSPFLITIKLHHAASESDCMPVIRLALPSIKAKRPNARLEITTNIVNEAVIALNADDYRKNEFFLSPVTTACLFTIEFSHQPVFIGGRYNKYSRTLSQTPWIVDGQRKSPSSVEELICGPLTKLTRAAGHNFSSSGREDVDVRMLGEGRPFLVELLNPHSPAPTVEELAKVQQYINDSTQDVQVRSLSTVTRQATNVIRQGDEDKVKHYSALIWTPDAITPDQIKFLNDVRDLTIAQKTPIRVLHRRTLAIRKRTIYKLSAEYLNGHHFSLHLSTQAGTYIKEFVHGDFGRTEPCLRALLGQEVDILCLDVLAVELKWPLQ